MQFCYTTQLWRFSLGRIKSQQNDGAVFQLLFVTVGFQLPIGFSLSMQCSVSLSCRSFYMDKWKLLLH